MDVTPDLVRHLLATQHPDLAELPIRTLANGWDNVVFRLGDELLVRLPRREMAAELVEHEQRWPPLLAPRLPLPVPAPVRVGRPDPDYATDLAVAWMLLPREQHAIFRRAYGVTRRRAADEDPLWVRARGWALALSLAYLAHSADNPLLARVGARTLDAVLADTSAA